MLSLWGEENTTFGIKREWKEAADEAGINEFFPEGHEAKYFRFIIYPAKMYISQVVNIYNQLSA